MKWDMDSMENQIICPSSIFLLISSKLSVVGLVRFEYIVEYTQARILRGGPEGPDPCPFSIQSKLCPQILKPI